MRDAVGVRYGVSAIIYSGVLMDSYRDLVARLARLEVGIEKSRKAETAAAIDAILQRMTEYAVTLNDIGGRMKQGGRRTRARVEPKYRRSC